MSDFRRLSGQELRKIKTQLTLRYRHFQSRNMILDMTRGKPCPEQLDLSIGMLNDIDGNRYIASDGSDCRNYGGLDGIPEAKGLFSEYMGVDSDEIIIGGNSSLNMMHDTLMRAIVKGITSEAPAWRKLPTVKFLCPSPGYDRHFFICEYLGIEMIPIEMKADGPDMDSVEELVASDDGIKGIWCVPVYSNPTGIVYSDEVVDRLAAMPVMANDFRIFWDNAYAVHHLANGPAKVRNILAACKQAGNSDRVLMFGSTSKITFAGAGVAMMAGSRKNIDQVKKQMAFQTIGFDKLNQLRHVRFFKDMAGIEAHMQKHAAILKPKFDAVQDVLENELAGKNIAEWSKPDGGYFVSIDTTKGCAETVVKMSAAAGVKLTPAGSTFPYQKDPLDRNIRIAPSFPPLENIHTAMELVAICIQLAGLDRVNT